MATSIRYIDIYSLYSDMDATVIESLLEDYQISCMVKHLSYDVKDEEEPVEKRVSVEEDKVEDAKRIITDAITQGIIAKSGDFTL
ncbi:MAG: hypothetical protein KAT46_05420 [Deltaproteobacteria bacterium]|nr:hypothetical protein [Deltaproteobacteria bacterium]